jgi:large repetitive protein
MRCFRIILAASVICVAAVALVPSASAGGIRDEPCPTVAGENTNTCPAGAVGVPYSIRFRAVEEPPCSPGDDKWTVSAGAPTGLTMSSEGTLSGTPTQAGNFSFYVEMTLPNYPGCNGSVDSSQKLFRLTINGSGPPAPPAPPAPLAPRLIVTTAGLPEAAINKAYSVSLEASGGSVGSWSVVEGALPDGLGLTSTGAISGTPTRAGGFMFRVQANGSPNNDTKQLTIVVLPPLALGGPGGQAYAAEPVALNGKVNTPLAWGVAATGGKAAYTYTSTALPAGLTLNPDGTLTGTPTTAGSSLVIFTANDALGTSDTLQVRITIKPLLAFANGTVPPRGIVGSRYRWKVPVTGTSKTRVFRISGKIPPGLKLNRTTGLLSGVPLKKGSSRIKVSVTGDPGTVITKGFTVKIV